MKRSPRAFLNAVFDHRHAGWHDEREKFTVDIHFQSHPVTSEGDLMLWI